MDQIGILTHCQIFDKSLSNAMDMPENFYKNGMILAEIDKNLDCLGHIPKYDIKLPQNFESC